MMMMWTFSVKRLKRRRRLRKNVLLQLRNLAKRKNVSFMAYVYAAKLLLNMFYCLPSSGIHTSIFF